MTGADARGSGRCPAGLDAVSDPALVVESPAPLVT